MLLCVVERLTWALTLIIKFIFVPVIFSCLFAARISAQPALYDVELQSLKPDQPTTLGHFYGVPLAISIFSSQCPWCDKQYFSLIETSKACPMLKTVLMGINSSKYDLKQSIRRLKTAYPAYVAPVKLRRVLDSHVTPRIILISADGNLLANFIGYLPSEKLIATLQELKICHQ